MSFEISFSKVSSSAIKDIFELKISSTVSEILWIGITSRLILYALISMFSLQCIIIKRFCKLLVHADFNALCAVIKVFKMTNHFWCRKCSCFGVGFFVLSSLIHITYCQIMVSANLIQFLPNAAGCFSGLKSFYIILFFKKNIYDRLETNVISWNARMEGFKH